MAGNACGPTALLNALRHASQPWRRATIPLSGTSDRAILIDLIRWQGMQPSRHQPTRKRWSKHGVSLADLADMAIGVTEPHGLPKLTCQIDFRRQPESPARFLNRTHQRFCKSLRAGFPPILSVRHIAWPKGQNSPAAPHTLTAHFVTLIAVSALDHTSQRFALTYIDPWDATIHSGSIQLPENPIFPTVTGETSCLQLILPDAAMFRKPLGDQSTMLLLGGSIGCW